MPEAIYNTTASNSGKVTTESHSVGEITGVIEQGRTGFAATYTEIPAVGKTIHVQEFPSQSADLDPKQSSR